MSLDSRRWEGWKKKTERETGRKTDRRRKGAGEWAERDLREERERGAGEKGGTKEWGAPRSSKVASGRA